MYLITASTLSTTSRTLMLVAYSLAVRCGDTGVILVGPCARQSKLANHRIGLRCLHDGSEEVVQQDARRTLRLDGVLRISLYTLFAWSNASTTTYLPLSQSPPPPHTYLAESQPATSSLQFSYPRNLPTPA